MSSSQQDKTGGYKGLAVLSSAVCSLALTVSGAMRGAVLPTWGGILMGFTTAGIARKLSPSAQDLAEGAILVKDGFLELGEWMGGKADSGIQATLKFLPDEYKSAAERQMTNYADTSWIKEIVKRSKMVVGSSGSGKTVYLLYEVASFVEENPFGRVLIGDINYGKPIKTLDGQEIPNTWHGLPKGRIVRSKLPDIADAIRETHGELQKRKEIDERFADDYAAAIAQSKTPPTKTPHQPWYLLVDEGLVTLQGLQSTLEDEEFKGLIQMVSDFLFEARAYNIQFTLGVQDLRVNELPGFTDAKRQQFNYLILGASAESEEVMVRVPGIGKKHPEWIAKVQEARRLKGCKYAGVVRDQNAQPNLSIRVVPVIDVREIKIAIAPEADPGQAWLNGLLTEELREQLADLAQQETTEGRSHWKDALQVVGLSFNDRQRKPAEYKAFEGFWRSHFKEVGNG